MAKDWAKPFYTSAAWIAMRQQALLRDGFSCEMCGAAAEEVHHEIELTPDNVWDPQISLNPDLLHSLCGDCHKKVTRVQKGKTDFDCAGDFYFDADGVLTPRGVGGPTPTP